MKIKILIIDDSVDDLVDVTKQTEQLFTLSGHVPRIKGLTAPNSYTFQANYDLAILDIDMPEMSGFEIAKKLNDIKPGTAVIFCTSHDEFVYQSFDFNAIYFVRKSHLDGDLQSALRKYLKTLPSRSESYFMKERTPLSYHHIKYFEVSGSDIFIYTDIIDNNGEEKIYQERTSMKKICESVPANQFLQPSQTHLINMDYIDDFVGDTIILKDHTKFTIVRNRIHECNKAYTKWLMR